MRGPTRPTSLLTTENLVASPGLRPIRRLPVSWMNQRSRGTWVFCIGDGRQRVIGIRSRTHILIFRW
jgi:hypothetical protein